MYGFVPSITSSISSQGLLLDIARQLTVMLESAGKSGVGSTVHGTGSRR